MMRGPFYFDRQQLLDLAATRRGDYAAARPFPHIVLDGFLPEPVLDGVIDEFPAPGEEAWIRFQSEHERKLASVGDEGMGENIRQLLGQFNSAAFIDFLQQLTGIAGLVPDPYLEGGGMHQILPGGHLNVHVDFNRHPVTGLDRRLNVLLYLNRDWQEQWGGALELWSADMQRAEQRILPLFNRLVVFSTTEFSFHGHPHPLACPDDTTRRSLALYYYSNGRPEENGAAAPTHNTVWAAPGETPDRAGASRARVKALLERWAPPAVLDAARAARRRTDT
jgi:hypothetical protein